MGRPNENKERTNVSIKEEHKKICKILNIPLSKIISELLNKEFKSVHIKTCAVCGAEFVTRRPMTLYCSKECRDKIHNRNIGNGFKGRLTGRKSYLDDVKDKIKNI